MGPNTSITATITGPLSLCQLSLVIQSLIPHTIYKPRFMNPACRWQNKLWYQTPLNLGKHHYTQKHLQPIHWHWSALTWSVSQKLVRRLDIQLPWYRKTHFPDYCFHSNHYSVIALHKKLVLTCTNKTSRALLPVFDLFSWQMFCPLMLRQFKRPGLHQVRKHSNKTSLQVFTRPGLTERATHSVKAPNGWFAPFGILSMLIQF